VNLKKINNIIRLEKSLKIPTYDEREVLANYKTALTCDFN
tara:strand:- start:323 stop:442 length:120 start_codon:yes stop_codon:yes gene_type:complete